MYLDVIYDNEVTIAGIGYFGNNTGMKPHGWQSLP